MKILFLFALVVLAGVFSINDAFALKTISDDSIGRDCASIGTWNSATKTCTLSNNLTEGIVIGSNGITLDGDGHIIIGPNTQNDAGNGIYLNAKTNVIIKNTIIKNFNYGIFLENSVQNKIQDNTSTDNWNSQIRLENSMNNIISNNVLTGLENGYGILVYEGTKNQILGNNVRLNENGIRVVGDSNTISKNIVENNRLGIDGSDNSIIEDNTVKSNSAVGIAMSWGINGGTVKSNIISNNELGLDLSGSNLIAFDNEISNNNQGLQLGPSSTVYHNNLVSNTVTAKMYGVSSVVSFHTSLPLGGNYWSDYSPNCTDNNQDNFCDEPYPFKQTMKVNDEYIWTIQDGWLTSFNLPNDIQINALDSSGDTVDYSVSATHDGNPISVTCNPASGSLFPIGETVVLCTADTGVFAKFNVIVESADTIPPVIIVPNNMAIQATSNNPSPVTFSVSATDAKDGPIIPTCSPKSGTTFVIGKTTVTCTAIDKAGNTATKSFTVTVTNVSAIDTDGDSIPDSLDSCPTQKETVNGYQDTDGCPDEVPTTNQIVITPTPGSGSPGCENTSQGCYLPKSVSVNVGSKVIFSNTDTAAHTFTAGSQPDGPSGEFDTSLVIAGSSYEWKPTTAGVYPYYCMVHPWMNGEIIVGGGTNIPPQPESKITVSTNKSKYNEGDTIVISGKIIGSIPQKITLQIFNQDNLVDIAQIIVTRDGNYSHTITARGPLWYNAGEYTMKVSFGTDITAKTQFFFNGSSDSNTIPPITDDLPYEIKITPTPGSSSPGCEETSQGCFIPRYASVATGGKVIFSNTDSAAHTFTAGTAADGPSGEFDTSLVIAGSSYEWTATKAGEIPYYCMVHPWREGILFVGKSPYPIPEPEPELISLNLVIEPKIYDIGNTVSLKMSLEGVSSPHDIGIDISDVTGKTIISRSVTTSSSGASGLDIKIAENFKAGTYRVVATTSVDGKTLKESTQFIVKSQYNQFKVTSVESTNQQGSPAPLKAGEIGFIKVTLESNKSITTLVTVNLFDSDLTSIGIGSVKTTLSSGNSEIILSFMIPKDAALGPADIYVNAFSDWPSNNGIPLTKEFAIQENIQ